MIIIDKTGEPRTEQELQESLLAVKMAIIKFDIGSPLTIHLTVIKDALEELLAIREFIRSKQSES